MRNSPCFTAQAEVLFSKMNNEEILISSLNKPHFQKQGRKEGKGEVSEREEGEIKTLRFLQHIKKCGESGRNVQSDRVFALSQSSCRILQSLAQGRQVYISWKRDLTSLLLKTTSDSPCCNSVRGHTLLQLADSCHKTHT